jgi:hypothetical protein
MANFSRQHQQTEKCLILDGRIRGRTDWFLGLRVIKARPHAETAHPSRRPKPSRAWLALNETELRDRNVEVWILKYNSALIVLVAMFLTGISTFSFCSQLTKSDLSRNNGSHKGLEI